VDRVNQRSVFTYGVTSRLLGRLSAKAPAAESGKAQHPGAHRKTDATGEMWRSLDGEAEEGSVATGLEAEPKAPASGGIRELARFSLFQSYDFANKLGDFIDDVDPETGEVLRGPGSRTSDLSVYLRLTPTRFVSFEGRTDYSVTGEGTKSATVGLFLTDPRTFEGDFGL